jgi:hypothetical protein
VGLSAPEDRATFACVIADCHDIIERIILELRYVLRSMSRDVNSEFQHNCSGLGSHSGGLGSSTSNFETISGVAPLATLLTMGIFGLIYSLWKYCHVTYAVTPAGLQVGYTFFHKITLLSETYDTRTVTFACEDRLGTWLMVDNNNFIIPAALKNYRSIVRDLVLSLGRTTPSFSSHFPRNSPVAQLRDHAISEIQSLASHKPA